MNKIEIRQVLDATELLRIIMAGRTEDGLKEIVLIVSPQSKAMFDEGLDRHIVEKGLSVIGKPFYNLQDLPKETSIVFPSGIKVTVTTHVQEPHVKEAS
jgi:hypothetical protein